MRPFPIIFFFLFCFGNGIGQDTSETITFLKQIRRDFCKGDSLFYTSSLDKFTVSEIRRHLSRDTIWIWSGSFSGKLQKDDSIILTSDEKSFITDQLKNPEGKLWNENLLEKSKLTELASHNFRDPVLPSEEKYIYSFSKPIFIRNNSLCFFYLHYSFTHYVGEGTLMLFKKVNRKWVYIQWLFSTSR